MSELEPGLDLHEWETRWSEVEEALRDDPEGALAEACDVIEEAVGPDFVDDDLDTSLAAARDTAVRVERGEDVDPGDVGAAVENLRAIRERIRAGSSSRS